MDDTTEFEDAFDELSVAAYRVGFRLLGERTAAEDVAQESMARALLHWRRIRGHATPWVIRVATNLALDRLRRASRETGQALPDPRTDDPSSVAELRVTVAEQLASLPRRQRDVVALRYLADLTEVQVASLLGVSQGAVKRHSRRGLAALRAHQVEGVV